MIPRISLLCVLMALLPAAPSPAAGQEADTLQPELATPNRSPVLLLTSVEGRARWHEDPDFPGLSYRRYVLVARLGAMVRLDANNALGPGGFLQIATSEGDIVGGPELIYQRRLTENLDALASVAWIDPGGDDDYSGFIGVLHRRSVGLTAGFERRTESRYDDEQILVESTDNLPFLGIIAAGRAGRYGYVATAAGAALAGLLWWLVAS